MSGCSNCCNRECDDCRCRRGRRGATGAAGATGATGAAGATGADGAAGATGAGTGDFAEFFALMPGDNAAPVGINEPVLFPQDGPTSGGSIARSTPGSFDLAEIGTYRVDFQVSVSEPGQLQIFLDGVGVAHSVVGRATGTSQIVGQALITTTVINSILEVRNSASPAAITITPLAGGTNPVSASLIIQRLA